LWRIYNALLKNMSSAALSTENVSGIALWPQLPACLRFATFRASKKREMGMRFIGLVAGVTALVSISGVAAADGYRGVKDYDRQIGRAHV